MARSNAKRYGTSAEVARKLDEGWVEVGGGNGDPWDEGTVVEGVLGEISESGFTNDDGSSAMLVTIGARLMRCPAILHNRLARLTEGDLVKVTCLGKVRTGSGRKAWQFNVQAKPQHGVKPAQRMASAAPKRGAKARTRRSAK